jgi:hypothetical protein
MIKDTRATCFPDGVAQEDMIVVYGSLEVDEGWYEVDESYFELLPAEPSRPGSIKVSMTEAGVVAAYSRLSRGTTSRARCFCFLPERRVP